MVRYITAGLFVISAATLAAQAPSPAPTQPPAPTAPAPSPTFPTPQAAPPPSDYSKPENWLCRPGRAGDACAIDLTTTVVAADGKISRETFTANPNAPIDCFYVYPTVSADQSTNSDMA